MTALSVSKRSLLGWQMALSLWRVTQFCPSHLLFSPLSWPCSPRCQLPSQVQMLALHRRSAEGDGHREEKEESWSRAERQVKRCLSLTEVSSEDDECG